MAFFDWGNKPINSTSNPPIAAGSTSTLYAELDSTQLGTVNLAPNQELRVQATWIVGGDTNITWQLESASSTALSAGVDVLFVKTPTGQTAQYMTKHVLLANYRLRARQYSTGSSASAYIIAEVQT